MVTMATLPKKEKVVRCRVPGKRTKGSKTQNITGATMCGEMPREAVYAGTRVVWREVPIRMSGHGGDKGSRGELLMCKAGSATHLRKNESHVADASTCMSSN
jgi:hypothetical protein